MFREPGRFNDNIHCRYFDGLLCGHLEERTICPIVVRCCLFNLLAQSRLHYQASTDVAEVSSKNVQT